jgi:exopolysaccharide biosynthesis polyprenyl glycosylphosphotransferase
MERLPFTDRADYRIQGFVDTQTPRDRAALGHVDDFAKLLHQYDAETVVVCGYLTDDQFRDVVDASLAAGCHILSVPRAIQIAGVEPTLLSSRGQTLIELTAPNLRGPQLLLKRLMDLMWGSLALAMAAPLMAAVAIAVKLDSRGPVFFRQERVGAGGRRFRIYKFRTMRHGASEEAHRALVQGMMSRPESRTGKALGDGQVVYKLVDDERVTRLGRWLRRASLDELPQLINVLRGDMSLVGPRPPLPYECDVYDFWQYDRLQVKPGITGLWQVSGRNLLTYQRMCELDIEYVRRWSLWLDLKILLKTIPVVLLNSGRAH